MNFTDVHTDRQKLGTILENKVVQKPSSKLIFFNEKKIRKIRMIFDIENWLWKSDLGTFWRPMWTSVKVKSKKYFSFTDFFAKIKPLLTHVRKTPPLRSHYYPNGSSTYLWAILCETNTYHIPCNYMCEYIVTISRSDWEHVLHSFIFCKLTFLF